MRERKCEVCGADCRRKKVGSQYNRDVICLSCHAQGWRFEDDGNLCTLPPYQPASNTEAWIAMEAIEHAAVGALLDDDLAWEIR